MNAESMMVDPNELVIDMPLDETNVLVKVESLRTNGMIQPVTIWLQGMRIIDGFHRTEAAKRLGWPAIPCHVIDCSEDAFWDARIQSAKQHHKVAQARLDAWIMESWRLTEWYVPDDERGEKWSLYQKVWNELFSFDRSSGVIYVPLISSSPLLTWLEDKASRWGMDKHSLATTIISDMKSRALQAMEGQGLNFEQAVRAAEGLNHENPYSYASRIGIKTWLDSEIKTDKSQPKDYFHFNLERTSEQAKVLEQYRQTPQGKAELEQKQARERLKKVNESIASAKTAIGQMSVIVTQVPEAPALLAEFAQFIADFTTEHFPDVQVAKPNPVALENSRLRAENATLKERIASLERALGSKTAAGEMLSTAMAWSSGDIERQ